MNLYFTLLKFKHKIIGVVLSDNIVINVLLGNKRTKILNKIKKIYPDIKLKKNNSVIRCFLKYLTGKTKKINLKFKKPSGSLFKEKVFEEIEKIPYGTTISYKDLAQRLGNKKLARACGNVLSSNPVPIFIPCHRVIKSDKSIGGFMKENYDRTGWKELLLNIESKK